MTINFPKTLPYPTVQGYAIKPGEAIVRTEMEAGPARQRRRYTQTSSRITVKWIFNLEQFAVFEAWYKYYAQEGGEWFIITLLGGIGLIEQDARFTQQFEASLLNGRLWEISSELEIRDRPTLREDGLELLLDSDYHKLLLSVERLHTYVNRTLHNHLN